MQRIKTVNELRNIIEDRYKKLGPGTKQNPIDFNDIDVSNLDSFCNKGILHNGIFEETKFKYIDISGWNVSNVTDMYRMFLNCRKLESVGDLSKWNVSNVTDMSFMFMGCHSLNQDLSCWDVSNVNNMMGMFYECKSFNQDLSGWNVSNVKDMALMFYKCESFNQDISAWDISNGTDRLYMFDNCPIADEYKPKFI